MVNSREKNSKSKRNSKGSTGKGSGQQNSKGGKQTSIVNISNYDMMLSLAEALHNSNHINDETYNNLKRLLKEEVKD